VYCKFLRFSGHFLRKGDDFTGSKNQTKNVLTNAGTVRCFEGGKRKNAVNLAKNYRAYSRSRLPDISTIQQTCHLVLQR
jgi:hypothetical protein